jgi:hypothetical protein
MTARRLRIALIVLAAATALASGGAGAVPGNGTPPTISGSLRVGSTIAADRGTWAGSGELAYAYRWYRCGPAAARCRPIGGASAPTYTLGRRDAGQTVAVALSASDATGATTALSSVAGPVAARGATVYATAQPRLTGTPEPGQQLRAEPGAWDVTPQSLSYRWLRCDEGGRACAAIPRARSPVYTVAGVDVGHALVARVTATVATTSQPVLSLASAAVREQGASLPAGALPLAQGRWSIPVASVAPPARLVIARVAFSPARIAPDAPFRATATVVDTRGYAVRGVAVSVQAPYGYARVAGGAVTRRDGTAAFVLRPAATLPADARVLVLAVRARKPNDPPLTGVSTTRLVGVRIVGR